MRASPPDAVPKRRRGMRAWLAPGVTLADIASPDGDPDRLLTRRECRIVKLQPKVMVGRVASAAGILWVKRYNVHDLGALLTAVFRGSPARAAWEAAAVLTRAGFETPEPVAAIEFRRAGVLRRSFFVTREVRDALSADAHWQAILAEPDAARRRTARRVLARALGGLFRRLHAAGIYHNDLKDVNVLVGGPLEAPHFVLLDLERVRIFGVLDRRRRQKNVVQLERTLGRLASQTDRARFLDAYLGPEATRAERRAWVAAVADHAARIDRERLPPATTRPRPSLSCTVVCQDEVSGIGHCLETLTWCDELVVVDGGSQDGTAALARRFTDRVLLHRWPGYTAQKQFALDAARGEWVLNVDADERVTPELAAEIRHVLPRVPAGVDGFAIPRLVSYLGRWWFRGGWYPRRVVRLVRRSATHWGGHDPHERAEVAGRVLPMRWPLLHYTYVDIADHLRSVNKLTSTAAAQPSATPSVGVARLVLEPAWRFVRSYVLKRGFREGFPGFFIAATDAFYVFLRWAKVRERRLDAAASALDGPGPRP